ncbi:MAG TPA: hypothetical protein VNW04_12830, partial [Puia sp.]|nr:hypothetical protein [Puia sp.]
MDMGSFDVGFDLSFIRREKLKELYRLIIYIRADSRKYFFNRHATKEYFLSLFLITVRQTQYADLHQLYGLKLSDLFAKKLELV